MSEETVRREAVRRVLGGDPVAKVAKDLGRSQPWVRKWVDRYDPADDGWVASRSHAPQTQRRRTGADVEALVVEVRQRLAQDPWAQVGASAIAWELDKLGVVDPPSLRTIERILVRHGVARRDPRRTSSYQPKGTPYPHVAATEPDQLHQIDVVGPRYVGEAGAKEVFYALNMIDVASRRPDGRVMKAKSAQAISAALISLWSTFGAPKRLQMDNQQAFAGAKGTPGAVTRLCLAAGVTPRFIPFAEPWRNGIIERFNDTFDKKFYRSEHLPNASYTAARYQAFLAHHHQHHRTSALKGATPDQYLQRTWPSHTPHRINPDLTIPDTTTGLTGRIEWVRLIRSDQHLHILERTWPMPEHVTYEYVTATLHLPDQHLIVTHRGTEIAHHPWPLSYPQHPPPRNDQMSARHQYRHETK